MAQEFIKFAGSPDIFRKSTGERLTEAEATTIPGIFSKTPGVLGEAVEISQSTRPGVTTEEGFAELSEQSLAAQELQTFKFDAPQQISAPDLTQAAETPTTQEDVTGFLRTASEQFGKIREAISEFERLRQPSEEEIALQGEQLRLEQEGIRAERDVFERGAILTAAAQREISNIEKGLTSESRGRLLQQIEIGQRLNLVQSRRLGEIEIKKQVLGLNDKLFNQALQFAAAVQDQNKLKFLKSDFVTNPDTGNTEFLAVTDTGQVVRQDTGLKGEEPALSVAEAARLGVPFGTTRQEAISLGVVPGRIGQTTDILGGNLTPTQRKSLSEKLGFVIQAGTRDAALRELSLQEGATILEFGEEGLNIIRQEIDRIYPEPEEIVTPVEEKQSEGVVKSFFRRLFNLQ